MLTENPEARQFLMELYKRTSGDPANQVSMYDVGSALGLERDVAGKLAEDLIGDGLAEVKTLSGGIAITPEGMASLEVNADPTENGDILVLGSDTLLDEPSRQALEGLLSDIREGIGTATGYEAVEEMIIDIKTAEVQLLSAKPKTAIFREILRSLQAALSNAGSQDLAARLQRIVER